MTRHLMTFFLIFALGFGSAACATTGGSMQTSHTTQAHEHDGETCVTPHELNKLALPLR